MMGNTGRAMTKFVVVVTMAGLSFFVIRHDLSRQLHDCQNTVSHLRPTRAPPVIPLLESLPARADGGHADLADAAGRPLHGRIPGDPLARVVS